MYTSRYFYVDILSLRISIFCEKWRAYLILGWDDTIGRPQDGEDNVSDCCHNASLQPPLGVTWSPVLSPVLQIHTFFGHSAHCSYHWMIGQVELSSHPSKVYRMLSKVAAPPRDAKRKKMFPLIQTHKNSANLQVEMKLKDPCSTFRDDENPIRGILCVSEAVWMYFPKNVCLLGQWELTSTYS